MARKITLKQAFREMREARATAVPLAAMADPDRPFMCINCNDETPLGCAVCCDWSIEICESFCEKRAAYYDSHPDNHIIPDFCSACHDLSFEGCATCNPDGVTDDERREFHYRWSRRWRASNMPCSDQWWDEAAIERSMARAVPCRSCATPCGFWGPPVPADSQHVVDACRPPRFPEAEEAPPLLREERCSETEQAHTLLREDAFPPARDEPGAPSPRPSFMEPEPVSPRATKRAERAAAIQRWRKANGWTGPFVRFAGEDADCYDAE